MLDVLHWIINIVKGLVEFTDQAATQLDMVKGLYLPRQDLVGDPDVTGHDGRQSQKLLERFETWTQNLSTHKKYPHMMELLGYWREIMKIYLMEDFGPEPETVILQFETLCTKIKQVTEDHFEATKVKKVGRKTVFGCSCLPSNMLPVYAPGFTHACTPGNVKEGIPSVMLCTGLPVLRRLHGHYEHDTLEHMAQRMRVHGAPLTFSSWLIDAANKRK